MMADRELVFSVTLDDCEVQTFRSGGKGGQNQNKRDTGVRIIHHPSGARGECREERSQLQNKKIAFKRMAQTPTFQAWVKARLGKDDALHAEVERMMWPHNLKTEVFSDGRWVDD
jgi:protein subunit release factor B